MNGTSKADHMLAPALAAQQKHAVPQLQPHPYLTNSLSDIKEMLRTSISPFNLIKSSNDQCAFTRKVAAKLLSTGAQHVHAVRHKDNCRSSTSISCMFMRQRRDRAAKTQVAFPGCSTAGCRSIRSANSPGRTSITYIFTRSSSCIF